MMSNATKKSFDILAINLMSCIIILMVLYNYFDSPIKLFSHLYQANFLDISAKTVLFV